MFKITFGSLYKLDPYIFVKYLASLNCELIRMSFSDVSFFCNFGSRTFPFYFRVFYYDGILMIEKGNMMET